MTYTKYTGLAPQVRRGDLDATVRSSTRALVDTLFYIDAVIEDILKSLTGQKYPWVRTPTLQDLMYLNEALAKAIAAQSMLEMAIISTEDTIEEVDKLYDSIKEISKRYLEGTRFEDKPEDLTKTV